MKCVRSSGATRSLLQGAVIVCLAGLFWPSAGLGQLKDGSPEQLLFEAANDERTSQGLSPLKWDAALAVAARQHASLITRKNEPSHQFPGEAEPTARAQQAGARFSALAENVAEGPNLDQIHAEWMKSPPHRRNLLDPQMNAVGIAVVDRGGQLFAVEDFSRTVNSLSIDQQESYVRAQLKARGLIVSGDTADARRVCRQGPGRETRRAALYMLRYTSIDLDKLPDQLIQTIRSGRYHSAEVGACAPANADNFAEYQVAVLFYQ